MFEKLNKVFGKKTFKGQGRRLGSSDAVRFLVFRRPSDLDQRGRRERKDTWTAQDQPKGSAGASSGGKGKAPVLRDVPAKTSQSGEARPFQGRPQVLGHGAATSSPCAGEACIEAQSSRSATQPVTAQSTEAASPPSTDSVLEAVAETKPAEFELLDLGSAQAVASEELQIALTQLSSGPEAPQAVLKRLFANILRQPKDTRFRRIRLGNPKIQAAIVDANGGLELLQACGFHVVMEDDDGGLPGDAFAVLPEDDELLQMNAALVLLGYKHSPLPGPVPSAPAGDAKATQSQAAAAEPDRLAQPCDRETQVILPAAPDAAAQVQDWVFRRTPAELRTAMLEARRKREQNEMLMTKAMREKLQVGQTQAFSKSTVRVRLPEGLLLQGIFNAREQVAAIYDWVTDCLTDPRMTFELVMPDRKPLVTSMGTLKAANMLPNVLLMLRCDGWSRDAKALTVKKELLRAT